MNSRTSITMHLGCGLLLRRPPARRVMAFWPTPGNAASASGCIREAPAILACTIAHAVLRASILIRASVMKTASVASEELLPCQRRPHTRMQIQQQQDSAQGRGQPDRQGAMAVVILPHGPASAQQRRSCLLSGRNGDCLDRICPIMSHHSKAAAASLQWCCPHPDHGRANQALILKEIPFYHRHLRKDGWKLKNG